MPSLDLTRDWLKGVLRPYPSRDILQAEILGVLQHLPSLAVKTDAFTFDSGSTSLLLQLHGTLPITYRGAGYHIPVHIWFPHEYPRAPPMVFVVPTRDMGVRKGAEVEPGGKVRETVLNEWWRTNQKTLDGIIGWLTGIFIAQPPVYAKPPDRAPPSRSTSMTSGPTSPSTPTPGGAPTPGIPARPHPQNGEALPQYRASPPAVPGQSRQSSISVDPPQSPPLPLRPGQQPPVPQRPVVGPPQPALSPASTGWQPAAQAPQVYQQGVYQHQHQQYQPHQYQQPYQQQQSQSPPPQSPQRYHSPQQRYHSPPVPPAPPAPPAPPVPPHPHLPMPPQMPQQTGHQPQYQAPYPTQPQHVTPQQMPQHPPPGTQAPQQSATLQPPARAVDLLSSPDGSITALPSNDTPPPLPSSKPPPPSLVHLHSILLQHLSSSLPPILHPLETTKTHLFERREDLVSGEPAIRDEMARLEAVKKVCDAVGSRLDEVVTKGSQRVAELEERGDVGVDEVVCSISIVHNQLIDLVAEDNAISDTLYHVTRAFEAERIDLDKYLKAVRSLAREQYMKRALIERINEGMGGSAWSVS